MRNIVLITLDSLRADHCSFMGYERETTPNIDKMAKNGLYFENAIASGLGTPRSLAGIFTGDYPPPEAQGNDPKPWRKTLYSSKTLAQVLSEKGYSTGAFNPNAFASSHFGFDKGFNYFQDFLSEKEGYFSNILNKIVGRNISNLIRKEEVFKPWPTYYGSIVDWVKKVKKPFFLWVLLLDTHYPYLASRKYRKWGSFFSTWYSAWKLKSVDWEAKLSKKERQKLIDGYDDSILFADSFLKELFSDLRDFDPIFIIHADHGEGFGEHDMYGHGHSLYEEFIHVPLVIYNSDSQGIISKPVSLASLAPSILELIGEKNEFPSDSLLNDGKGWVISEVPIDEARRVAVRMDDWKFITGQKKEDELYHLKKDPFEQENVIDKTSDLAKQMRKIVEQHIKRATEIRRIKDSAHFYRKI